jgi:hypothetical protein
VQSYTVHEPPNPPADRLKRAERFVFVREGFSWTAALFAPLWMLAHRMWLVLLLYLVGVGILGAALTALGMTPQWISLISAAIHIVLGFELGSLRRWTLERKRWQMLGAVTGRNRAECERRFFQAWFDEKEPGGSVRFAESRTAPHAYATSVPPVAGGTVGSQA